MKKLAYLEGYINKTAAPSKATSEQINKLNKIMPLDADRLKGWDRIKGAYFGTADWNKNKGSLWGGRPWGNPKPALAIDKSDVSNYSKNHQAAFNKDLIQATKDFNNRTKVPFDLEEYITAVKNKMRVGPLPSDAKTPMFGFRDREALIDPNDYITAHHEAAHGLDPNPNRIRHAIQREFVPMVAEQSHSDKHKRMLELLKRGDLRGRTYFKLLRKHFGDSSGDIEKDMNNVKLFYRNVYTNPEFNKVTNNYLKHLGVDVDPKKLELFPLLKTLNDRSSVYPGVEGKKPNRVLTKSEESTKPTKEEFLRRFLTTK